MNISPLFPILRWSACLFKAAALLLEQELHLHSFPESWGCSSDASFALKLKVDLRCGKEPSLNSCYAPHRERCCYPHFSNEDTDFTIVFLPGEFHGQRNLVAEQKDMCSSSPAITPNLQLAVEQLSTRECSIPPKNDNFMSKGKGEDPTRWQEGKKNHIQNHTPYLLEMLGVLKQNFVHTKTRRPHRDLARPAFEYLSVYCGSTGQQWPSAGTRSLVAADLGHTECGISLLGEDHCQPCHRATKQMTHKLQYNYTKEITTLLRKFQDPQRIS